MLTSPESGAIITLVSVAGAPTPADVAQLAEQLICNQQVAGSSPFVGSKLFPPKERLNKYIVMERFPSGQREQTVNLLALPSVVRIHLRP